MLNRFVKNLKLLSKTKYFSFTHSMIQVPCSLRKSIKKKAPSL